MQRGTNACSRTEGGRVKRWEGAYFGGSLTLLESHAWETYVSMGIWGEAWRVREGGITYQALEDTLACGRAAGLDLPHVILGDLLELQLIRHLLWPHGCLVLADTPRGMHAGYCIAMGSTHPPVDPACSQTPAAGRPSFPYPG